MDALSYLHWLKTTELESARESDLEEAVSAVVAALERELKASEETGSRDMLLALQSIERELKNGKRPMKLLEDFRVEFDNDPSTYEPPELVLEQELREIAAGIGPERWSTETYHNLEKAVQNFLEGGEEDLLWDVIDEIDKLVEGSHQSYNATEILPKEVTLESAVVHKLLCEGMEWWKDAIETVREDEEPDWASVLQMAENGNRLLLAVQIFNERVQRALA